MSILRTENLTKKYGKGVTSVTALDHVNISIKPGEFVAVMGPSGCGKSTLMHLLGGLDKPTEGRVLIENNNIAEMDDDDLTKLRRRRIGFVFQFFNLIPVLSAVENAALPVLLDGINPADARKKGMGWALSERFKDEEALDGFLEVWSWFSQQR